MTEKEERVVRERKWLPFWACISRPSIWSYKVGSWVFSFGTQERVLDLEI